MNKQEGMCPECGSANTDYIERYEINGHEYNEVYRCMDCECNFADTFKTIYEGYTVLSNGNK